MASTPLAALPAVSLDTETTSLDSARARLVQIGAVRLLDGQTLSDDSFETLVDPGEPISATSTGVHGISDEDVEGAPGAGEAAAALAAFVGDAAVIGHSIGFDIEVLRREAERAGTEWPEVRALDVRPLAQIALPGLAAYDLDALCSYLDIVIEGRHTAIGDATATARLYLALLPHLRRVGIRTLAEAETASRRIGEREAVAAGTRLAAAPVSSQEETVAVERIDSYPYRRRVSEVMSSPPVVAQAGTRLRDALDTLIAYRVSSVFVEDKNGETGILTERDVLRALHARGPGALDAPIAEFCSTPLATVRPNDFVYRAIGRMDRLGIRHLGVADETGRVVGAITTRNLLRHRASTAMVLGDQIAAGGGEPELAAAWAQVPVMAERLCDEGVDPRTVAGVISAEIRMLTRRAAELGETRMRETGGGEPPAGYAVLVLGSGGRGESLLAADQDNAIVYAASGDGDSEDAWFAELGKYIADILDHAGIPYCSGGVMAREAAWRKSDADWRATIDTWIGQQRPEDLLNVDIFFDATPVHGEQALGESIWAYAYERGGRAPTFWRGLAETMRDWRPAVGTFGGFRTGADGRADLKAGGLMPIFTAARILSIKTKAKVRATPERLRAAAAAGLASENQIEELIDAHQTILGAILRQQIADVAAGVRLSTRVDIGRLRKSERAALRAALRRVPGAIDLVREGMM